MGSPRAKCLQGLLLSKLNEVRMHAFSIRGIIPSAESQWGGTIDRTNRPPSPPTPPKQLTPPPQRAWAIQAAQRRLEGVIRANPRFRDGRVRVFGSALSELGTARCVGGCMYLGG